jgi:ribosome-binding factor A
MSLRMEKVNMEIRRQITHIIQDEVDDPTIGLLSITRVDTSPDLKESKVYFSLLDDTQYDKVKDILDKMSKLIRVNLAKRIRIKILPELKFIPDDSIKYSVDICQKIDQINKEDKENEKK